MGRYFILGDLSFFFFFFFFDNLENFQTVFFILGKIFTKLGKIRPQEMTLITGGKHCQISPVG